MTPPITFPLCIINDCPLAHKCLRRQALLNIEGERRDFINIVNPTALTTPTECPHFKEAHPVRMARGFRNAIGCMPHANIGAARSAIAEHFSLRFYYLLRNGERPMTPDEQKTVAEILEHHGAPSPVSFDRYYDDYIWF